MAEMVWVEHPDLESSLHQVTKEKFEKNMGMNGWVLSEAPLPTPREEATRPDPMEKRRKELAKVNAAAPPPDPNVKRRKDLAAANRQDKERPSTRADDLKKSFAASATKEAARTSARAKELQAAGQALVSAGRDFAGERQRELAALNAARNPIAPAEDPVPKKRARAKKSSK